MIGTDQAAFIASFFLYMTYVNVLALSTNQAIPASDGDNNLWAYYLQAAIGFVGLTYNSVCIAMMLSIDDSKRVSFYSINVSIISADLSFSFHRLFYACFHLAYGSTYHGDFTSCFVEAFFSVFLTVLSILLLTGMSWVARHDICSGIKISQVKMIQYVFCSSIYAAVITSLTLYAPNSGAQRQPTGTWCLNKLDSKIGTPFLFVGGWIVPFGFLTYNIYIIAKTFQRAQKLLALHNINETAKAPYLNMVMKMGFFIQGTLICFTPISVASMYEGITGQYFPIWLSIFAGSFATSNGCFVNPSLFFYLNKDLREAFSNKIGNRVLRFFSLCKTPYKRNRIKSIEVRPSNANQLHSLELVISSTNMHTNRESSLPKAIETLDEQYRNRRKSLTSLNAATILNILPGLLNSNNQALKINYFDVDLWLIDPLLFEELLIHGRKEYSLENFLFYQDARNYYFKGLELIDMLHSLNLENIESGQLSKSNDILKLWAELEALGHKIYTLYVWVPNAPLEVNLPFKLKKNINDMFLTSSTPKDRPELTKYPTLDLSDQNVENLVMERVHVFDESIDAVKNIIETDTFSRFTRTSLFKSAIEKHKNQQKKQ